MLKVFLAGVANSIVNEYVLPAGEELCFGMREQLTRDLRLVVVERY